MSNGLLLGNVFAKAVKWISFMLDHAVYYFTSLVYEAFHSLANASILDEVMIRNFTNRIYAIIGVIMIFVIAFSLLNYIVDPDKISDNKVGASTVVKDIIIALVILTMLPTVFVKLYSLQDKILSSGVISNLILGGYSDENAPEYDDYIKNKSNYSSLSDYYIRNGANIMIANIYSAFLVPSDGTTTLDCGTDNTPPDEYCTAYKNAKETGDIDAFSDIYMRDDYKYFPFLSTVGGIAALFFMLSFCLNLGKRVGKLAVLQLIAPIPVVMEILPNKKGVRKTWLEMLFKTYIEVFIYMAVIYMCMLLISLLPRVVANIFGAVF